MCLINFLCVFLFGVCVCYCWLYCSNDSAFRKSSKSAFDFIVVFSMCCILSIFGILYVNVLYVL